ncbi:hypothetical protein BBJ28_00008806 [Nothophytophthora sp. Chile5]|nr:hypothetical protein BBJ28_00008806 [Nothophytophthora sp. Chile5]
MSRSHDSAEALELTETAMRLSKVIERETKRRSALHRSSMFHVEASMSAFGRSKVDKSQRSSRSSHSRRSVSVLPTPEEGPEDNSLSRAPEPEANTTSPSKVLTGQDSMRTASEYTSQAEDAEGPAGYLRIAWNFFEDPQSSVPAYYFSVGIFGFIIISTIVFVAETEATFGPYMTELTFIEEACAIVFSFELIARLLVCPSKVAFLKSTWLRRAYYYSNWIDFAAVFPFYLETIMAVDNAGSFGAIRIVRLTRVARVLKMSRYSSAIQVFTQAIAISIKPLSMLIFLMSIAMVIFSSAIYFAEYTDDGCRSGGWMGNCVTNGSGTVNTVDVSYSGSVAAAVAAVSVADSCICVDPNPYQGIATSFWWCIVTMSTVGYGDMTPVTWAGKMVGCCTVLTGMLVLALPITVIGTNFQKVMKSVMHQTMKSNVDYLKGKRMLCRDEIQAILQRFHAVTEDIHLDIDDVINVYDTDNSGMLEDDELAKFRHDLEVLQNRALLNQLVVPDAGLHQHHRSVSGRLRSSAIGAVTSSSFSPSPESPMQSKAACSDNFGPRGSATTSSAGGPRSPMTLVELGPPGTTLNELTPISPTLGSGLTAEATTLAPLPNPSRESLPKFTEISGSRRQLDEGELMLRLLEMQQGFQDRLLETEQRLEAKLLNLTKILMRLEGMMELDD